MNAATLHTGLGQEGAPTPVVEFNNQFLKSRLGVNLREQRCPSCRSVVYTRRHGQCGVCERKLPTSYLFSTVEVERLDALLQSERQRHKAWLSRFAGNLR